MTDITRREFVKVGAAGAAALAIGAGRSDGAPPMPERPLGKTGYKVRIFSLGGQATLETAGMHDESIAIINRAIDLGVNYIDTAAAYGRDRNVTPRWEANGISQTNVGEVMKTRRKEVFLASKTDDRTRDGSLKLLEQSLKLLNTDHLDLWQLHNVMRDEQLDQIFGKDGAIEAMQKARDREDGPIPRDHRPLRPGGADEGHRAVPVRHDPDGAQPGRQAPPAVRLAPSCRWPTRSRWASSG